MKESARQILEAMSAGRDLVLVTIVDSKGSTPRGSGSQMLASCEGLVCGTIGGGALEGHALSEARLVAQRGLCKLEDLALRPQPTNELNMICGGDATLLYVPIGAASDIWRKVAQELLRVIEERIPSYLVLGCHEGEASFAGEVALLSFDGAVLAGSCALSGGQLAGVSTRQMVGEYFVMPVVLPTRAIVFGGGHVGKATIAALSRVGFACTLFECRPEFAQAIRVPEAEEIILGDYFNVDASLSLGKDDYVLIMTNSHSSDFAVLEQVLRQPLAYVGFMGSRRKIATARARLLEAGVSEADIDAVHMPIGLKIEAETPEEIAVSVAAECILHRATH